MSSVVAVEPLEQAEIALSEPVAFDAATPIVTDRAAGISGSDPVWAEVGGDAP